ncbi:MAG: hypothetical protein LUQ07_05480 [Methanospirillum sp.]|nr:hypothetical protein [Methanospirillum sp.]
MTSVYERDLDGMKYTILKSPYHKEVVSLCASMLGIPPMKMRRIFITHLDMMMLESLGVRYDRWNARGDQQGGMRRQIGYELFSIYIPVIPGDVMKSVFSLAEAAGENEEEVRTAAVRLMVGEMEL